MKTSLSNARAQFAVNIAAFERAWYGQHDVDGGADAAFRACIESIRSALAAPQGAVA